MPQKVASHLALHCQSTHLHVPRIKRSKDSKTNLLINGPRREKTCLRGFANNTGADQTAHPCSLISAFVIHFLESIRYNLATGGISIFWLVSVVEETGLKLALSETPKTGFVATRPKWYPLSGWYSQHVFFHCEAAVLSYQLNIVEVLSVLTASYHTLAELGVKVMMTTGQDKVTAAV